MKFLKTVLDPSPPPLLGWLSNRSLSQTFSFNPSLLYQAVRTQATTTNNDKSLQFDLSIRKSTSHPKWVTNSMIEESSHGFNEPWAFQLERCLGNVRLRPHSLVQKEQILWNFWYKLRLISQPSCTGTNIQESASGAMIWLKPKCKQYKLRPLLILEIPRSSLC